MKEYTFKYNIVTLIITAFITGLAIDSFSPFFSLYMSFIGVSLVGIGLVYAVSDAIKTIFQPFSGFLADNYNTKTLLVAALFMETLAYIVYLFAKNTTHVIFGILLFSLGLSVASPSFFKLVSENISEKRLGSAFGILFSLSNISEVLGLIVGGALLGILFYNNYRLLLTYTIALMVIGTIILHAFLRPKPAVRERSEIGVRNALKEFIRNFVKCGTKILPIALVVSLISFIPSAFFPFIPLYLKELNLPLALIGLTFSIRNGISLILSPLAGGLSDKLGRINVILLISITNACAFTILLLSRNILLACLAVILLSVNFTLYPVISALIAAIGGEQKGQMIGIFNAILSFVLTPSCYIGGYIVEKIAYNMLFFAGLIFSISASFLVYLLRHRHE